VRYQLFPVELKSNGTDLVKKNLFQPHIYIGNFAMEDEH